MPAPVGSDLADRRRRAELAHPADPLRAVVLTYPGGAAELILVADRGAVDAASLALVADVVLGHRGGPGSRAAAPVPLPEPGASPFDWAVPDPAARGRTGVVRVPLGPGPTDGLLADAVAAVLARYDDERSPAVATLGPTPQAPGPFVTGGDQGPYAGVLLGEFDARYRPGPAAPFPLTFLVRRGGDERFLELHHQERAVDGASARRFATHVAHVHAQLGGPAAEPGDVELLDEHEYARVAALGATPEPSGSRAHLDELFTARVALHPEAPALTCDGHTLTYREVDQRAGRFAAALRSAGVRPGDRVGICLERSSHLVVTMLAAVRAGAVYVPMDPAYPRARLEYTVRDAGLALIVADGSVLDGPGLPPVLTTADLAAGEADGLVGHRDHGAPAYVIYTSGSTGRPKGVVVPHENVTALVAATRGNFGLGTADVWTFFHSGAFDFSVWEIWAALLTGGRLVVVPYWTSRSVEDFHALLAQERVTVLNQTPSAFAQLVAEDARSDRRLAVRLVIFGGEPLDARLLLRWHDRYPEPACRAVNMFGITETTVHVTEHTVTRGDALAGSRSVGRALPGWSLRVIDERGRLQPIGAPGEICVGGRGVAAGYLGKPALTAQRFVPDPWSGGRMYRSGDRGRLRADGSLEHLGRIDSQVKIRGFRIELDEIRTVLLADPAVTAAAVVVGGGRNGDAAEQRLDAYVVLCGDGVAGVRERAARMLPEYMVPATVTAVESLPLTVNGKLDRNRLPAPAVGRPPAPASTPAVAADGGLAGAMAAVWQDVLGVPVDGSDNFFELGGNSLYAVRIASLMRERGLPRLPLRELYRHPRLAELADHLVSAESP
ncbi:amino acid adenylation domain-containing protein [Micromonospora sp. DT227]|uniref:non-ribosomal peptide synthetase n=1 Tax=Micromonospora sp. DT227 TaxID=3393433 RepID=UPI003CE8C1AB